ncbi:MAG: DUF4347 domain-containing protein, partial [Candidatus Scalindua sp.]|nr:DUF4347 domain-containing protein [Candidatus Scalindua sp.]
MMSADVMSAAGAEALMGEQSLIEETAPVEIVAEQEEEAVLAEIDSESKEIAFIDTSVTDHETMVKDLKKEVDAGRNLEIVLIDSESDGIARITETLAEYDDLDAVHIYSHGSDGQIRLGDSWIDQTTLSENPETANAWGESLSEDADILIYGCDLASTEVGEQFVDKLAQLTGADITASDDMTGSATFGGDWDLEYAHGQIETETLFDEDTDLTWSGLLAAPTAANNTVTTNEDTTYTFTASDFNYSDGDGDAMSSIEITTLESVGSLQLSGIDVTINQVITKADIDAGNLTFVPVTAQNGSGYDSFGFSVNDGSLDSVSSYTMTLDVTAVNDASSFSSTTFSANTITTGADGANSVTAVDMDGDGDMDLLSASSNDNTIAWYENDGSGSFTEHNITTSAIRAVSVTTADMDGDGDMDVISNTSWGGKIDWYENDGSENFTAHTIDTFSTAAVVDGSVHVADVDGDGDLDVLAATANSTQIAWYENDGSENFTSHYITTSSRGFFTLTTADVDGDGDLDVVSASNDYAGKIDWYENDGSENFTAHTIDTYSTGADVGSVHVADIDDDGDLDLLLATYTDDKIIWYENDGSENFTTHTITSSADGASSVTTADVDGDGDLDILSASKLDDKIVWYENDGSENFSTNTITTGADGALSVIAADMDGDGDLDVISASYNDDTIRWYENTAVSTLDGAPSFTEGGSAVVLDANVEISDTELDASGNYSGASLTLVRNGGTNASDQFSETGTLSALTESGNLVVGGTTIGTVTTNSGGTLVLTFNSNATRALVNSAMQQIAYSNSSDAPSSSAQINWSFDDGNSGSQGTGGALQATGSTTVSITAVNDVPTASNNTVTTNEDTTYTLTASDFNFTDVDGDTMASIKVTTLETVGALQLSGVDVTLNQVITKANIDSGNLKFVPVANANGSSYDSFAFSVNDGTADSASSYTLTVDVTAVNDAPTAANNTVTTNEDTTYTFTASDFSFSDIEGSTMASIKVTTLETAGSLQLSGVDVTLNQVITKADIDAGNLKFVPVANANGSSYDSFAFSVNDGTADSASSYTLTVDVTAVNDAPTITNLASDALNYTEGDRTVVIEQGADVIVTDVDLTDFDTGTLTVSFTGVGSDQEEDILAIRNQGYGTGEISIAGYGVAYEGTLIGSFTGGANGVDLVITFNANANAVAVEALIENITYENSDNDNPTIGARTVRFVLNDGDGDTSANYDTTVNVSAANDAPTFLIGDGIVTTGTDSVKEFARSVTVQDDGQILVAGINDNGSFVVNRYNQNGSLDTTFGTEGTVTTLVGPSNSGVGADLIVQADGKIVVTGWTSNASTEDFILVRYNANGTLDDTFDGDTGNGNGIVTTDFSGTVDYSYSVVVQADGKIVVGGISNTSAALTRYNTDGTLDTDFGGGDGKVTFAGDMSTLKSIALQSDGKIVMAGYGEGVSNKDFMLMRSNTDGTLDTDFGTNGITITPMAAGHDYIHDVMVLDDGRILVAGEANYDFALALYDSNGDLDTSFGGGDGKVTTAFSAGVDGGYSVTVQDDGMVLVAGYSNSHNGFVLFRFDANGAEDTSFGTNGLVTTDIGSESLKDKAYSVTVQSDGKILVAGDDFIDSNNTNFTLVRYNADGSLDTTFDAVNTLDGTPTYTEGGSAVVLDSNVQISDTELDALGNYNGASLTLVRNGGANASDQYSETGTLSALTESGNLVVGGTTIGTVTTNSGGTLVLTFNSSATSTLINSAMQQIAYSNSSDAPSSSVQIDWSFDDGNSGSQGTGGALQATGSTTVSITAVNDVPTASANTVTTNEDTTYTFTASDFSFSDVDGDTMASIKVTTLETVGALQLSGVDVTLNQVITKANIDAGNLKFVPVANANGSSYDSFAFSVND